MKKLRKRKRFNLNFFILVVVLFKKFFDLGYKQGQNESKSKLNVTPKNEDAQLVDEIISSLDDIVTSAWSYEKTQL